MGRDIVISPEVNNFMLPEEGGVCPLFSWWFYLEEMDSVLRGKVLLVSRMADVEINLWLK